MHTIQINESLRKTNNNSSDSIIVYIQIKFMLVLVISP